MTTREAWDRYKFLALWLAGVGLPFAAGVSVTRMSRDIDALQAQIPAKVDTSEFRREMRVVKTALDSIAIRQQQFFCADKPSFCR